MASSNIAFLTRSHKAIAAKKRGKKEQVKEVVFDDDARREFLTGFHKRNVVKRELAKKKAIEREKQERLETRREQRKMLAERAVQNAAEVERAYGAVMSDEEWTGFLESPRKGKEKQKEDEYEDEEQLATVTVVEDFDPDIIIHGPPRENVEQTEGKKTSEVKFKAQKPDVAKTKPVEKPKKIKYQTKAARKADKMKQRARRTEKAELAGGKASRKKSTRTGRSSKRPSHNACSGQIFSSSKTVRPTEVDLQLFRNANP